MAVSQGVGYGVMWIALVVAIILYATANTQNLAIGRSLAFLLGSFFSGLIGTIGMNIATRANVRVALPGLGPADARTVRRGADSS